jgi:hypothetical protein
MSNLYIKRDIIRVVLLNSLVFQQISRLDAIGMHDYINIWVIWFWLDDSDQFNYSRVDYAQSISTNASLFIF